VRHARGAQRVLVMATSESDAAQKRGVRTNISTRCPANGRTSGACPGYVVDHVVPLKRGGADEPSNMRWQTREADRAKDKVDVLLRTGWTTQWE
jgi:hypothetical protein